MRRQRVLTLLAGAVLLILAACTGAGDPAVPGAGSGSDRGAGTTVEVPLRDPAAEGPAAAVAGASEGGTVTVHLPDDPGPSSLDPTAGWPVTGTSIQQALTHRSLTQYRRDASGRSVLVPDLATDLGRPNEDFTRWTFTIRRDATWEDGKVITPEEVAWGITRSLDRKAFPGGAGTAYSQHYFAGADDFRGPYTDRGEKWDGVTVEGQDVTIAMSRPFPDMGHWGAFPAMGPAPLGAASRPPGYGRKPLSNGPYKVESFEPGEKLVLVRNDQWRPESDPARHQYVDRWVFEFDQEQAKVDEIMLSGSSDSQKAIATRIGAERLEQADDLLGDRLVRQAAPCVEGLAPDHGEIPDVRVRRALAHAYPYEDAWFAAGEVPGVTQVPASGLLPPAVAGSDESVALEELTFDPERARELLAEAGHGDTPYPITMIHYAPDPVARDVQDVVTRGLEESGFEVEAIAVRKPPHMVWLDPEDRTNQQLNLRGVHWCADWPSGSTVIPPLLGTGAPYNTAHFSDPDVDEEIARIATLPLEEQAKAWGELDVALVRDHLPIIPTGWRHHLFAFGEKIGNPTGDGARGAPNYKDLFVAR